jgi:hypothetical protein
MTKRILLLLCIVCACLNVAISQTVKPIRLSFVPVINSSPIELDQHYFATELNDSISISKLKFYISNIVLLNNEKVVYKNTVAVYLLNAEDSLRLQFDVPQNLQFNRIQYGIGIDSVTNTSGALDGALDPLMGMYWTWQSGYINFKMEGFLGNLEQEDQKFEYHLGGYSDKNNAYQLVDLSIQSLSENIQFQMPIDLIFNSIFSEKKYNIMSPSTSAVLLSKKIAQSILVK